MSVVSVGDRYDVTIGRDLLDQVADVLPEQAEQVLVVHSEALPGPARRVAAAITGSGRVAHLAAVPDAEHELAVGVAAASLAAINPGRFGATRHHGSATRGWIGRARWRAASGDGDDSRRSHKLLHRVTSNASHA